MVDRSKKEHVVSPGLKEQPEEISSSTFLSRHIVSLRRAIADQISTTESDESHEDKREVVLDRLDDPEDKRFDEMYSLMEDSFSAAELDSKKMIAELMREGTEHYLVGVDDTSKEVVAMASAASPSPIDSDGEETNERFLFGCYIAVKPEYRKNKLGQALFWALMQAAQKRAEAEGKKFIGYFAEGSEEEKFFNSVHAKRLYICTGENAYEEIPYYQTPLQFDDQGNGVKEGDDDELVPFGRYDAPEHLVFASPSSDQKEKTLPVEKVMQMVRGLYEYNSMSFFDDENEASNRARELIDSYASEMQKFLDRAQDGKIYLLSVGDRQNLESTGAAIAHHTGA